MTSPGVRRGGRGAKFDREEARRLRRDEGWTLKRLAEKYGVTAEAVRQGIDKYELELNEIATTGGRIQSVSSWPWVIAREHAAGDTQYKRMLALRKQLEGKPVSKLDASMAHQLSTFIARGDLAVTYHREVGFAFTRRLPEDGDDVFVVRSPEWWSSVGYAA